MKEEAWNPGQYNRFRGERMAPFADLVSLVKPAAAMRIIDLGCGTGELTALLAERFPDATVLGIDSSEAMLREAEPRSSDRVRFECRDIGDLTDFGPYDLVFAHASLQWIPDNERLMHTLLSSLRPGAQIAVQMPRNFDKPSHTVAAEVARESPFRELLGGPVAQPDTLPLERYAELFHGHGFQGAVCFEKIYGHELASSTEVVEWVKGTLLTVYLPRLDAEGQAKFIARYRERLLERIGVQTPYFYPFRRMLLWGRKG